MAHAEFELLSIKLELASSSGILETLKSDISIIDSKIETLIAEERFKHSNELEDSRFQLNSIELERQRLKTDRGPIHAIEKMIVENDSQIQALENRIEELKLKRKMLEQSYLEKRSAAEMLLREKLVSIDQEIFEHGQRLNKIEKEIANYSILAPISGVITASFVAGAGEFLSPNTVIAEMAPTGPKFVVEVLIPASKYQKVTVGQEAKVILTSVDFLEHGHLNGRLSKIAANSEIVQGETERVFRGWIQVLSNEFSNSNLPQDIIPGLEAQVHLREGRQAFWRYLTSSFVKSSTEVFKN